MDLARLDPEPSGLNRKRFLATAAAAGAGGVLLAGPLSRAEAATHPTPPGVQPGSLEAAFSPVTALAVIGWPVELNRNTAILRSSIDSNRLLTVILPSNSRGIRNGSELATSIPDLRPDFQVAAIGEWRGDKFIATAIAQGAPSTD